MKKFSAFFILPVIALVFSACSQEGDPGPTKNTQQPTPSSTAIIYNLPADPATSYTSTGTPIGTTGKFKFFSFATGQTVPNSDSLTTKWDVGFRGTTIIVNGGVSRIGNGGVKLISEIFDNVAEAPQDGYLTDGEGTYAIPTGSGNGWYNYNAQAGTIIPIAGKVLVFRTGEGKFAKMEILSYYKDAPANPTQQSPGRYYTFRYTFQPDGTRKF